MAITADRREAHSSSLQAFGDYLGAVVLCNGVGASTALLGGDANSQWFKNLEKPSFNPPSSVFAPVWTVLYTIMGISLGMLWRNRGSGKPVDPALRLFALQLVLNGLWTFLFFRWKSPGWALLEIMVLFVAIAMTIRAAWRVSPQAAALLIPYLVWVGFATILNGSIWWLNRS